jgi:arylsulfatase A-like enzyme
LGLTERRDDLGTAVVAGALGGVLAGVVDAGLTLSSIAGLTVGRAGWLFAIAVGVATMAGALLTTAGWIATALTRRAPVAAALVAAPLVVHDAFALFAGPRASQFPVHRFISALLVGAGLAGAFVATHLYLRVLRSRPSLRRLGVTVLLLVALALHHASARILPRLYPWFHVSVSLLFLAAMVAAVRLALGPQPPLGGRRAAVVTALGAVGLLALSLFGTTRSQIIRYAAHERTELTSALLRRLPLPRPRAFIARSGINPFDTSDLPLPDGPHRANADVVLITVDALRADHVGAYGYPRPTTPAIDALAGKGVRFERAYAQAPHTSFSVASMLTGKYYPTIARLAPGDPHDPIAEILRNYGWKTAAFFPDAVFFVDAHKLKAYDENNFRFEYVKRQFSDAFERLDQIRAFFDAEHPRKAFLWLHMFEPHEPYDERAGHHFGKGDLDRYDSEIAYTDEALGQLFAYLHKNRPNSIIILAADHGEEFDEHGGRYHGSALFEQQVRVPLIIAIPGVAPHVVEGPVELIDVAPTVLGLLDIPIPARMRGTDLGPWLRNPPAPNGRLPPAFAELGDERMVATGTDKAICKLNWGVCAYYDLKNDPLEQRNLADERPQRTAELKHLLDEWLDDHVRFEPQLVRGPANPDGGSVPRAIERGRLGDLSAVGELAALLSSGDPLPVRREAARLLVALPPRPETRAAVLAALSADDREVRQWAEVAAARLHDGPATVKIKALVTRPDPGRGQRELRLQAALALAANNDPTGVPVMAEALDDCQQRVLVCQLIILKLGELGDRRAVPSLLKHVPEVQNRREMVEALGHIGDPGVVPTLVERLRTDEYVPVRVEAARGLARIGGPEAVAGLKASLRYEHEARVQAAAREALAALQTPVLPASQDK